VTRPGEAFGDEPSYPTWADLSGRHDYIKSLLGVVKVSTIHQRLR
jgi:hypothetical protein